MSKFKTSLEVGVTFLFLWVILLSVGLPTERPRGEVVCFGDSITNGAEVNGDSWVAFLQRKNMAGIHFVNEGRNGRRTTDRSELLPVIKKHPAADYFLIFLGVNDLKNGNEEMVDSCVRNVRWMISRIRSNIPGVRIVILSPSDINLKTMSSLNKEKQYNRNTKQSLRRLKIRYKRMAKEENIGFISLLNAVSKKNYVDGLHPSIEGQKEIAEAVWKGLVELN